VWVAGTDVIFTQCATREHFSGESLIMLYECMFYVSLFYRIGKWSNFTCNAVQDREVNEV